MKLSDVKIGERVVNAANVGPEWGGVVHDIQDDGWVGVIWGGFKSVAYSPAGVLMPYIDKDERIATLEAQRDDARAAIEAWIKKATKLEAQRDELLDALLSIRDHIETLPVDALGTNSEAVFAPGGGYGRIEWPIRDEMIDNINKIEARIKGESVSVSVELGEEG